MPKYKLNRDHVISGGAGHRIVFKKGEPTHVPKDLELEVVRCGGELVGEGEAPNPLGPEAQDKTEPQGDERYDTFVSAFRQLEERRERVGRTEAREDWTASGSPVPKALVQYTGFKITRDEVEAKWKRYVLERAQKGE